MQVTDARLTIDDARRLAIRGALLSGPRPPATRDGILTVERTLGHLQIDPTRTVEKTHLLMLWSRLGAYDPADLDALLWRDRRLFEYAAFIVPLESLPDQRFLMERFATGHGSWDRRVREWLASNEAVRARVLARLVDEGPLPSRAFSDVAPLLTHWRSSGWTDGRNVTRLFEFLHQGGQVMVSRRQGNERVWDVPERVLPADAPARRSTAAEFAERRAALVVRRLGIAQRTEIAQRVWYVGRAEVDAALARLADAGRLTRVRTDDGDAYVSAGALDALDGGATDHPPPRTTLLSPFDPLIKDRDRTERLFRFSYRLEMYVPKTLRRFGHFVLPILHRDRLIGRIDPLMDRRTWVFRVNTIHLERDVAARAETRDAIESTVGDLAAWLGARDVAIGDVIIGT